MSLLLVMPQTLPLSVPRSGCSIPGMEVIADGIHRLAGRGGRHVQRLQALVVAEGVGDSGKRPAVAADKPGKRAVRAVRCAGDVVDAAAAVDGRERPPGGIRRVSDDLAAGIGQGLDRAIEVVGIGNVLRDRSIVGSGERPRLRRQPSQNVIRCRSLFRPGRSSRSDGLWRSRRNRKRT